MKHITVGIFGDRSKEIASSLGKKGTANDILIFNHASSEGVFTYVCPNGEKIQPLLQCISMSDIPVIVMDELTKEIGEVFVAISEYGFDKGFIITKDEKMAREIAKGTCIESFEFVEEKEIRERLAKVEIKKKEEPVIIPVDNYFDVKSVGAVVLGIVKAGKVKKYDRLMVEPLGKEVLVKGIQSQDKALEETEEGMRVGLNIKGIKIEEMKRGFIVTDKMEKGDSLVLKFKKSKYYKDEIGEKEHVLVSAGLQVVTASAKIEGDNIDIKTEAPIAYNKNTKFMIASTKQSLPRIIGTGKYL